MYNLQLARSPTSLSLREQQSESEIAQIINDMGYKRKEEGEIRLSCLRNLFFSGG
jgi:hypothetical protein